ncbi:hypothetical protein EYF80_035156 [Liparis tanakae]|uniref:Uncharacterized protein n=1 Tax=Liparis tanakae TaxID=230148 RepID=A0A4Z2GPH6_9TELE|nr:hypothetical protein EYF80_035156 [Liparis tanakae]
MEERRRVSDSEQQEETTSEKRSPVGGATRWRGNRRSNATDLAVTPTLTAGVFEPLPGDQRAPAAGTGLLFSHLEERKQLDGDVQREARLDVALEVM